MCSSDLMGLLPADALPTDVIPNGLAAKDLIFGIRPEDLILTTEQTGDMAGIPATVTGSEFLGAETFVYVAIPGTDGATARLPGRVHLSPGNFNASVFKCFFAFNFYPKDTPPRHTRYSQNPVE